MRKQLVFTCVTLLLLCGMALAQKPQKITIQQQSYRGWNDALVMSNGVVEAVIVPSIGRVMQDSHSLLMTAT